MVFIPTTAVTLIMNSVPSRVQPAPEGANAPQYPTPLQRGAEHEGNQMCCVPGHGALRPASLQVSR